MTHSKKTIIVFLKKILFVICILVLVAISSYITIVFRDRQLYNLPNKVNLNNLAKLIKYERTPFVYIRKSGNYLGNVPSLDTPFYLGPLTQTYTATLILNLHKEGDISLDDPVTKYFQHNAIPFSDRIIIKDLLSHKSGLIDINKEKMYIKIFKESNHRFTLEEIIKDYTFYDPAEVGKFHSSITGYHILGKIIEKVTETTYEEYLHTMIIDPLELKNTCIALYDPDCQPIQGYVDIKSLGLGLEEGYKPLENRRAYMTALSSAGFLAASANDLITFMKHLIDNTFFDFEIIEVEFSQENELSDGEKSLGGSFNLGLISFGKNLYGNHGQTIDSSTQVIIEKDTKNVYLYYFGEPGL